MTVNILAESGDKMYSEILSLIFKSCVSNFKLLYLSIEAVDYWFRARRHHWVGQDKPGMEKKA